MARRHEVFVGDKQWEKIEPFIPKRKRSPRGGRPPVDDRACLEGILWVLRSGAGWRAGDGWWSGKAKACWWKSGRPSSTHSMDEDFWTGTRCL